MNKKLLCAALLAGLGVGQIATAQAQQFDDRWYVTGSVGFNFQDTDRRTNNAPMGSIGLGKFISPNWSIDGELNYQNPNFDSNVPGANSDLNWHQYGISFDLRRHFIAEGRGWNPYLLMGLGYQRSEEEYDNFPNPDSPQHDKRGNLAAKLGAGIQSSFANRVAVRAEIAVRADFDDNSIAAGAGRDWEGYPHSQEESYFTDTLASVGIVIPLGPAPMAPVAPAPAPAPVDCSQLDSDGDGVNDCLDRCPNTPAGTVVGPDGCPVEVSIDLRGVNFNFDYPRPNWNGQIASAGLVPGSMEILNEAVSILQRYPQMRVQVAGHTDLCGTESYNQSLSERRARAVYQYLVDRGIAASRLSGPVGFGESRPLVNTPQTLPGCRNETNRRTELNPQ